MPGTWATVPGVCESRRTVAYARCRQWADQGSQQCRHWADQGSNACRQWHDDGSYACSAWADRGHRECCTWWPCSWFCNAFYWVAKWICLGWYWVAHWVCLAWYWIAKWVCLAWFWVAKWICMAWEWVFHIFCTNANGGPTFLLTDGSVLLNESVSGFGSHRWWKLVPDANGSYTNAIWQRIANSNVARTYFAAAVLADGRLIVSGGEFSDASGSNQQDRTTATEIYDPVTDVWTTLAAPPTATQIGDAPCAVLPDGRLLVGEINTTQTFIFTPGVDTWAAGPAKGSIASEESWVLMPDNTVLTPQAFSVPNAEKYNPGTNTWISANALLGNIFEPSSAEIGPGILLTDGRAFFVGAQAGATALYRPGALPTNAGTWVAGPNIPNRANDSRSQGSKDGPGALVPGGKVLFPVAPVDGVSGNYLKPCSFYEFDGVNLARVSDPPNADCPTFVGRLLPLPSGEVLWARADNSDMYLYLNTEAPDDSWRPVITNCPAVVVRGTAIAVSGEQFNGLSQAQGYGDDYSAATNYPLVRVQNRKTNHVRYCRTADHTTTSARGASVTSMGVATGTQAITTQVQIPDDLELGDSDLYVVANGIPSEPWRLTVTERGDG
jgi:hypothetical protein